MSKQRLDRILSELYPNISRSKLQSLIEKGKVRVFKQDWQVEDRPGAKFEPQYLTHDKIQILQDDELLYVSRGALKLKEAIREFAIPVQGQWALDVGLSTGGFTDFLLQSGAEKVLGIDVGSEQLHHSLRNNSRLTWYDKINAKQPLPDAALKKFFNDQAPQFDLIVVDVSFISLTQVVPNLIPLMGLHTNLVTLLKPQFELSRQALNKKGVVKTEEAVNEAKQKVIGFFAQNKLKIRGMIQSPIEGENGNKEFLVWSALQ